MAVVNGTPCNFAFHTTTGGITITSPSLTGNILLQSAEHSQGGDNERTRDGIGNVVISAWVDPHTKASLEWVITAASLSAAATATTLASFTLGAFVTVGACASRPDLVGTTWEVMAARIPGTNQSAARMMLELEKRAGVTAAAT